MKGVLVILNDLHAHHPVCVQVQTLYLQAKQGVNTTTCICWFPSLALPERMQQNRGIRWFDTCSMTFQCSFVMIHDFNLSSHSLLVNWVIDTLTILPLGFLKFVNSRLAATTVLVRIGNSWQRATAGNSADWLKAQVSMLSGSTKVAAPCSLQSPSCLSQRQHVGWKSRKP